MFPQFLRRFLVPQLLLIVAAVVIVALAAGIAHEESRGLTPIVVTAIVVTMLACGASAVLVWRAGKRETEDVAGLLLDAVPAVLNRRPSLRHVDDQVLKDIAATLTELMNQADEDQAQLLTIISSMSDGLIATDHQQRILLTNDAAREMMNFRIPDARGKQLWEIVPIEEILKAVTQVSLTGERKTISIGPVNAMYLEVTICRLPLRPAGFVIVAHDVTETMRYEELRKEFVANVSHELRTPLTVIKGFVETLKDGAVDDRARAIQYLTTVERHTEQLTNLVDDLLSLSRLDSSPTIPSPRPVHLERVAAKVMELMTPAAEKKGHRLVAHLPDSVASVIGNPEYLERAIANLVENAIKYTRENGLIRLVIKAGNAQTIVEVSDNGIGISPEDMPRIFERFYRAERSRSRDMGGTGLGLSIVKHIVQVHGGTIEVESKVGEGSTFRLRFPVSADSIEETDAGGAAA